MKKKHTSPVAPSTLAREEAEEAWQDVLGRAMQVFAFYTYRTRVHGTPEAECDPGYVLLKNASLESSLMALRDLEDFFSAGGRDDDIRASHFGYPAVEAILTPGERTAINKKLAHLTYAAVRESRADPHRRNPRTWNNADLVNRVMKPFLVFVDHLEHAFFQDSAAHQASVRKVRAAIQLTLSNMNAIARAELDFNA